jgi:hypothetical protein
MPWTVRCGLPPSAARTISLPVPTSAVSAPLASTVFDVQTGWVEQTHIHVEGILPTSAPEGTRLRKSQQPLRLAQLAFEG